MQNTYWNHICRGPCFIHRCQFDYILSMYVFNQFTLDSVFYDGHYLLTTTKPPNQRTSPLYIQSSKIHRKDSGCSKKSIFLPSRF